MLLFCDSFAYYSETHLTRKWDLKVEGTNRVIDLGTAFGHLGRPGVLAQAIFNEAAYLEKALPTTPSTIIVGGWLRGQAGGTADGAAFWSWYDGATNHVSIRARGDGQIIIRRGTTVLVRSTPGWLNSVSHPHHFVEAKIVFHDSAGSVEVRIDGVTVVSVTGVDTMETANPPTLFRYGLIADTGGVGGSYHLTEFYMCDDTGADNNDFLGPLGVLALFANGAGARTDYTPSAGNNYQCVDETSPNDDTDYVESNVSGDMDVYDFGATGVTSGTIHAVAINTMDRLTNTGPRKARHILRYGGGPTVWSGDVYAPGTSYANEQSIFSGTITVAEADDMQCGFEIAE